ncbi:hypothetical protein [Planktothrix phage Pra-JY27]|nr:hypothetical protein [Planktothrix phage Pag-Yong1]WEV89251.1 hypothetical protein [Synechococcus phage MinM2]
MPLPDIWQRGLDVVPAHRFTDKRRLGALRLGSIERAKRTSNDIFVVDGFMHRATICQSISTIRSAGGTLCYLPTGFVQSKQGIGISSIANLNTAVSSLRATRSGLRNLKGPRGHTDVMAEAALNWWRFGRACNITEAHARSVSLSPHQIAKQTSVRTWKMGRRTYIEAIRELGGEHVPIGAVEMGGSLAIPLDFAHFSNGWKLRLGFAACAIAAEKVIEMDGIEVFRAATLVRYKGIGKSWSISETISPGGGDGERAGIAICWFAASTHLDRPIFGFSLDMDRAIARARRAILAHVKDRY